TKNDGTFLPWSTVILRKSFVTELIDFGTINPQSQKDIVVNVDAIAPLKKDSGIIVNPYDPLPAGVTFHGWFRSTNTITLRLVNIGSASITPTSIRWLITQL